MLSAPRCERCGAPTAWPVSRCRECAGRRLAFASARAAVAYSGPARPLLQAWKEHGLRRCAELAAEVVAGCVPRPEADVIAYIPPDPARQLRRGGHPAAGLARELGEHWRMEVRPLLARTGSTGRQTGLRLAERRRNVRGAFVAVGAVPARIVLVDDVYTTGATADSAARALRRAGARYVEISTFARAVRDGVR